MKRPQKVTRETRPNQYARKMYGKEKTEKIMEDEDMDMIQTSRNGEKKKIRTLLNLMNPRNLLNPGPGSGPFSTSQSGQIMVP